MAGLDGQRVVEHRDQPQQAGRPSMRQAETKAVERLDAGAVQFARAGKERQRAVRLAEAQAALAGQRQDVGLFQALADGLFGQVHRHGDVAAAQRVTDGVQRPLQLGRGSDTHDSPPTDEDYSARWMVSTSKHSIVSPLRMSW